eukprot:scaffold22182_cov74-Phaeocystis_antarctica.AAC.3
MKIPQVRPQPRPFAYSLPVATVEERLQKRRPPSAKRACVARAERRVESATTGYARKALAPTVHAAAPLYVAPSTASLLLPTCTQWKQPQSLPTCTRRASRPRA